ncbi:MAG: hypothetical protein ACR2O6_03065 [Ilumatobacteraceae bacterium]
MSDTPKAFAIDAAEGAEVHLDDSSEDEQFTITVRKDDSEVETHEGLTADTLEGVSSEHFNVAVVEAPSAPADESDDDAPEGDPPEEDGGDPPSES